MTASVRSSAISVAITAIVLAGLLLLQHTRHGWPFSLHHGLGAQKQAGKPTLPAASPTRVAIELPSGKSQQFGVRLEPAALETVSVPLRTVATVVPDESRIAHAHTRVAGWVEDLRVNTTGQFVRRGEPLARIFSQELLSSQTEYLVARRNATSGLSSVVVESGRTRLKVLGMTEAEIQSIEASGEPMRLVTVIAPRTGIVIHRGITVGTAVDPSTELITIADLSAIWILAEIPEAEAGDVQPGTRATLEFPALPNPISARVEFVYPTLTERTRTVRARLVAANPGGTLRPGMFGTAEFQTRSRKVITVPRDAVVDTGTGQHVFVVAHAGHYEPRTVTLGAKLRDRVEVAGGLEVGENVVAAGVFLIDSESRLRASGGGTGHQHGAAPAEKPAAEDPHAGHQTGEAAKAPDPHAGHKE